MEQMLDHYYKRQLPPAARNLTLGAADNAVELPTGADSWRFETFTVEKYESLYQQMVDGTLVVDDDYTVMDNAETATNWSNVNVNII